MPAKASHGPSTEPAIDPVAADLYSRDPSVTAFGLELLEASSTGAAIAMTVRRDMCNGFGILHGGMTFLLADSAMAFASNAEAGGGASDSGGIGGGETGIGGGETDVVVGGGGAIALASSAEIDWLAPVNVGDVVVARAQRSWSSGRSSLWDITVTRVEPNPSTVVALMRGRTRRSTRRQ